MQRVLLGLVMVVFCGVVWGQSTSSPAGAEHAVVTLWPKGAPGVNTTTGPEADTTTAEGEKIAGRPVVRLGNVSVPTITVYEPKGTRTGSAVVVFPGGGYRILAMDLEGTEVCDWLTSRGVACFLLKYRVPDTGPYPKSDEALEDAQRAVGMVRARAAEWKVDPKKVGVLGFSAGAHLAAAVSTHYATRLYPRVDAADDVSCRPDFAVVALSGVSGDCGKGDGVQSGYSGDEGDAAYVSGAGGGRPYSECGECCGVLSGFEARGCADGVAYLCRRRPWVWVAADEAAGDGVAGSGGRLDEDDWDDALG